MTGRWARRDAERTQRRVLHLVLTDQCPTPYQVAYLRRQVMALLLDEGADLPDAWLDDLRELNQILERFVAAELDEETAP